MELFTIKGLDKLLLNNYAIEKDLEIAKQAVLDSAKELQDAQIELTLGVDADKVRKAGEEAGKFFSEAAARGSEIDRLTKEIEVAQITLNRELAKGLRIFEEQRSIAEDTNNSTQVRLAAAAKAQEDKIAELTKNATKTNSHDSSKRAVKTCSRRISMPLPCPTTRTPPTCRQTTRKTSTST